MAKGKRWAKGQSSSSNPSTRKYRDISKNNRGLFSFGLPTNNNNSSSNNSQLTRKALAELDSMSVANDNNFETRSIMSDNESNADTFKSWATNWSDCTNATFNKVHKYWQSNSALHKEILAVLAAITEVIKENDGKETETEYFAALMTGLESVNENEESATAFLYLIALAIKKVPENVLRAKYDDIIKALMIPLNKYGSEKANNTTLIKSCLMSLCWLLKSQDKLAWEKDFTIECYLKILNFIQHSKPKIRKCGQEAIRLILNSCNSSESSLIYEYVSSETANYCLNIIINNGKQDQADEEETKKTESKNVNHKKDEIRDKNFDHTILYTLQLLKYIVHHFQVNKLKSIAECLLRLMTIKDIIITSNCFQILHQLFNSQATHLSDQLNAQIVNALYDFQPSENDPLQLIGWLNVTESAIKCLNRLNKQLCITHLPHFFQVYMNILSSSHHKNVHVVITNCLNSVLEQCVQTNLNLFIEDMKLHKASVEQKKALLHKIFSHLENGLSYQFHESWLFVMKVLTCAFTSFKHRDTFPIVEKCLSSLGNLRESDQFEYKKEADLAIGRAIQTYGPKLVLDCISLEITGDETNYEYPRSWMLPILKDNIEKTELEYFISVMLPLANKLKDKSVVFLKNKQQMQFKIFENLVNQIWALLPGFCNFPVDFGDSFKNLAKTLGETLEKKVDLRPYVLQSLRMLINRNSDENKVLMSKYAKNYLSIMFNIYTTEMKLEKDPIRQSLLDTIKCYLKITDTNLINTFLTQSIQHYENHSNLHEKSLKIDFNNNNESTQESGKKTKITFDFEKTTPSVLPKNSDLVDAHLFAKYSFLDLISFLVKYSNETNVKCVYELAINGIGNKVLDKTLQKKCYKILDSILSSGKDAKTSENTILKQNDSIFQFIESKFQVIATTFVTSLADCNAAAKAPRLKCLLSLMDYVKLAEQKIFLRQILPEVILCIKEINYKSRDASLLLLNSMLRAWQKLSIENNCSEIDSFNEFMHLVMVGLAGSTNMISCTCLALASLTLEFKENISGSLIGDLIETSCLLSKSEHKEVVISSLNLLKILTSIFMQSTLAQYLTLICNTLHNLHEKRSSPANVTEAQSKISQNYFNNLSPVAKSQQIRSFVKLIIKKLIKKFSYEIIHEKIFETEIEQKSSLTGVVKQGLENLLLNIKKSIEKDKKRKLDEQAAAKKKNASSANDDLISVYTTNKSQISATPTNYNEVEDLLKDSDDSDDEIEKDAKSQKSNKTNRTNKRDKKADGGKSRGSGGALAWLQENENDDPLDLLDPMAIKRVLATKPLTKQELELKKAKEMKSKSKNRGFKTEGGKLIIDDNSEADESDDAEIKSKKKTIKKPEYIEEMMDTLSLSKKSIGSGKKNKLKRHIGEGEDSDDSDVDTKSKFSYKSGGTGIHRKIDKNNKTVEFGSEYKSKKARGDIKHKNKPDPYAYLPLNFSKLNKRKRAKLEGEYKGVVKAIRNGVQKGKKARQKRL